MPAREEENYVTHQVFGSFFVFTMSREFAFGWRLKAVPDN
jgi:hypothetical protein